MIKSLGSDKPCCVDIPTWAKKLIPAEKLFAGQRACRSVQLSAMLVQMSRLAGPCMTALEYHCVSDAGPNAHQLSSN